jgi:hypothetical protein
MGKAGAAIASTARDAASARVEADGRRRRCGRLRAGQQQQADVEGVAEEEAGKRRRHHRGHAQVHQHRRRLLARRADAEIGARDQHVAAAHAGWQSPGARPPGSGGRWSRCHASSCTRRQRIGVDIGGHADTACQAPRGIRRGRHASTSRASAMRPRSAEAATV